MRFLTTLRSQFVVVVAAAVILSNLAVVAILEAGREGEISGARMDAAVDRIAAVFDYISNVPESQRDEAVGALGRRVFHFAISDTAPFPQEPMDKEEERIAKMLVTDESTKTLGSPRVRLTDSIPIVSELLSEDAPALEIAQQMGPGHWLSARFERQPFPSPAPDILIAAALGTLLTGVAAAWLAGRVSRPLSALALAADDVARGRIAPRLSVKGPDDIRRAAEAFNEMSDRVTRTLESQRQLLSAVGHDLRTPIAAMRITAEFVEDAEVRDRLTRNLEELKSLTEAVLASARSTPGEEKRRVDLSALIESVCDDLVELSLPVEVDIQGSAPCLCRPNEIRRAVRNLIENAARYGGSARVSLKSEASHLVVTVDDNGPGIPDDKLEDVFEPFVRLESSRNNATGGAGLGLTLARSIAREHGGDVVLENRRGGGLRASLRLPREQPRVKEGAAATPAVASKALAS
jgi:signal transduction histidine kinase